MHNYIVKYFLMLSRGEVPSNTGLHDLHIEHDDWCAMLNCDGECNCDPTLTLTENVTVEALIKNMQASANKVRNFRRANRQ